MRRAKKIKILEEEFELAKHQADLNDQVDLSNPYMAEMAYGRSNWFSGTSRGRK